MLAIDVDKGPQRKVPTHEAAAILPWHTQSEMLSSETEKLYEAQRGICICRWRARWAAHCPLKYAWTLPEEAGCKSVETGPGNSRTGVKAKKGSKGKDGSGAGVWQVTWAGLAEEGHSGSKEETCLPAAAGTRPASAFLPSKAGTNLRKGQHLSFCPHPKKPRNRASLTGGLCTPSSESTES